MLFCLDMDMTERKRAEEALRQSEEKYRIIVETANEGVWITDAERKTVLVNQRMADMLGFTMEEMQGSTPSDFLDAGQEQLTRKTREELGTGARISREFKFRRKDGSELWVLSNASPVLDGEGRHYRTVSLLADITERKKAEDLLKASEQRLREARGLLEAVTLGAKVLIATVDKDFRYTFFNQEHHEELKRLTGENTKLGMSLMEVLAEMPEERDRAISLWGRALKGETVVQTLIFGDPGRYRRWYNTRHVPIRDAAGAVIGAGEVTSDVTELMRAQQALRESEERLRLALDAGAMATWDWHIPSGEVIWNDEHFRMLGYEVGSVKPSYRAWVDRMHPDDAAATEAILRQSMERGVEYSAEFRVLRPDGIVHWLEARGRFERDAAGQPVRSYGVMLNITKRKYDEEALRASRAAAYNLIQDAVEARAQAEQISADLRASEERFRLALRNAPVSVATQDRDLRFQWAYNQRTVPTSEVVGKTDTDLFPAEDAARLIALKRRVLETEAEVREQLWLTSNGQRLFLELCLEPMRNQAGQVIGIGIATVDLTPDEARRGGAAPDRGGAGPVQPRP